MAAYPFGRIEDVSAGFQRRIDCDPLDFSAWKEWAYGALWLGNFDGAADIARNGLQKTAHEQLTKVLAFALIAKRQFDEAEAVIERDIHYKDNVLAYRLMLAAARADKESAEELLGQVLLNLGSAGSSIVSFPAVVGDRDRANQLAADIDARPYGYMILMESTFYCLCGAPFDITVAPNFARMLNEAELSWPPASPIDWPLKQW
jgi:tetratricopeptide (TPR) repeat protein